MKELKKLREMTGAGMLDCKKALDEAKGDVDKAIDILREKGIAKALKKQSRIAAEGLTNIIVNEDRAIIIEVNSETDFVAKNAKFQDFVNTLSETILKGNSKTMDEALKLKVKDETLEEYIAGMTAIIGEKLSLRRFKVVEKKKDEIFGDYLHMGGKIASLVVLKGKDNNVALDVAMQVAAMRPKYIKEDDVDKDEKEHEMSVLREQIANESPDKNEDIREKMLLGRMKKFYKDICLLDQPFIQNEKEDVRNYLKNNKSEVISMYRYEVGEGMEKREDDFLKEVMSQIK